MLYYPDAFYERGRTKNLLKVKVEKKESHQRTKDKNKADSLCL